MQRRADPNMIASSIVGAILLIVFAGVAVEYGRPASTSALTLAGTGSQVGTQDSTIQRLQNRIVMAAINGGEGAARDQFTASVGRGLPGWGPSHLASIAHRLVDAGAGEVAVEVLIEGERRFPGNHVIRSIFPLAGIIVEVEGDREVFHFTNRSPPHVVER
jgi:hypothetical protein